jgi:type VI secretion system secreted protein VgrG
MPLPITFNCPLPHASLRFESMTATQAVSALDSIEVDLVADKADIAAEKLLGQPASVVLTLRKGGKRHFNGLVARFGMGRSVGRSMGRYFQYRATLRPWLWFLTRTADCRIFQDLTVPQIVEKVFGDHAAIANFEFKLFRSYRQRGYCVQYRETDFNFVARLLEEEGIYWFFEHSEGAHKLMLVDDMSALSHADGAEKLPYYDNSGQAPPDVDYISGWSSSREVRPGKVALTSYDFERPSAALAVDHSLSRSHALDDAEQFDFSGDYTQKADGQHLADCQLEEQQARFERQSGQTNARALAVGHLFDLTRHPRPDQNAEHLCLQTRFSASIAAHEAGAAKDEFQCDFAAMPAAQAFRPERITRKPFVLGPQTAVVVGPSGEEIFTDKYGRVKVQFHWDRYGRRDASSSCWVRVSSPWAGKSFGFVQIPRMGQEVVVDFLEGDPNQPIITGRVYNAEQMPPWELPANATQSGVLTRSSKGGAYGNANALRFEDKKGAEQLWLHAEKNQDIEVENDETHWVGHDRTKTIDHDETSHIKHDRTETVDNNETITVHANRSETVDRNESIAIGVNRTENVGANESIAIGANRSISVGGSETATVALQRTHAVGVNETIAIGAAQEVAIGAAQAITVGAAQTISVGAKQSTTVGSDQSLSVGKNQTQTIGQARSVQVGKDDTLKVGQNLVIEAGDSITIKTGSASITMKKDGTVVIKGKDISLEGSGKINVKASSDVVIKGSKVGLN